MGAQLSLTALRRLQDKQPSTPLLQCTSTKFSWLPVAADADCAVYDAHGHCVGVARERVDVAPPNSKPSTAGGVTCPLST